MTEYVERVKASEVREGDRLALIQVRTVIKAVSEEQIIGDGYNIRIEFAGDHSAVVFHPYDEVLRLVEPSGVSGEREALLEEINDCASVASLVDSPEKLEALTQRLLNLAASPAPGPSLLDRPAFTASPVPASPGRSRAFRAGEQARRAGLGLKQNPFPDEGDAYQDWCRGWLESTTPVPVGPEEAKDV